MSLFRKNEIFLLLLSGIYYYYFYSYNYEVHYMLMVIINISKFTILIMT